MFEKMKHSFDDFSEFKGTISTTTYLKGNLTKDLPVNIGACLPVIVKDKEIVS